MKYKFTKAINSDLKPSRAWVFALATVLFTFILCYEFNIGTKIETLSLLSLWQAVVSESFSVFEFVALLIITGVFALIAWCIGLVLATCGILTKDFMCWVIGASLGNNK